MTPRGEVGIVVAGLGAAAGVLDGELFAVLVGASVLTSLIVPPLLRWAAAEASARDRFRYRFCICREAAAREL